MYQYGVYYLTKSGSYRRVAVVATNKAGRDGRNLSFAIMNGLPAPKGTKVYYEYNPLSLRKMGKGDLVEDNTESGECGEDIGYYFTGTRWERTTCCNGEYVSYRSLQGYRLEHSGRSY